MIAIWALAEFFGLEEAKYHETTTPSWVFVVGGDRWTLPFEDAPPWVVILFAAFVEAELHKRRWYFVSDQAVVRGSISDVVYGFDDMDHESERVPCDPEDPISKAEAMLMAAAGAVSYLAPRKE